VTSPAPAVDELVLVSTADQMRDLGRRLARLLRAGDLVVLSGPLGAGKTTLAQGIGTGLGVRGPVTSPTFVIARVHPNLGTGPDLVHADAYRLGSRAEVDDLDLDADLATAVTVVEWGEGLVEGLADSCLQLAIEPAVLAIEQEGTGPPAEIAGGEEAELAAELDLPRTVQVRAFGHRWLEAAGTARAVLAGEPHGR
jgi:tRNA threonylcarbamoyl adenosine modification protein YjeE